MFDRLSRLTAALALIFLVAHLRALPRTLEDQDSINFALGVETFDVAKHQPHPPGYPVFIVMAKASTATVAALWPSWDRDRRAATGLAIWSVLFGTIATFVLTRFWLAVGLQPLDAWLAMAIAVTSPLFWLTAGRPLTDTPGLVAAVAVQISWIRGLHQWNSDGRRAPRVWIWAALASGLIIGLRSQTMWLTGPFLLLACGLLLARRRVNDVMLLLAAAVAGLLLWFVPLVWASGGLGTYFFALGNQGADDFAGVQMLATSPSWPLLRAVVQRSFVAPWAVRIFAHTVLALALLGAVRLAWRRRPALGLVLFAFVPYLLFHFAFQETETLRYALPFIVPIAGLAVMAIAALGVRAAALGSAALVVTSLVIVQPRLQAYALEGAPVFRAFQDMQQQQALSGPPSVIDLHHQVWWGVRRVFDWYQPVWGVKAPPFPGDREWLDVVRRFRAGDTRPVWFLAHLPRTDLVAFDPRTTSRTGVYRLADEQRALIGAARLDSLAWWTIDRPRWMLGRGWSLNPEQAGATAQDQARPDQHPAEAFVTRGSRPLRLMIGGRYLGPPNGPAARVAMTQDDLAVAAWTVTPAKPWFVEWMDLPDGLPEGREPYAMLRVRVTAEDGSAAPIVGLEQFDVAGSGDVMFALVDGWYEHEAEASTGRVWRWTSERSTLYVRGPARTLVFSGESPLKNFREPPRVTVRAGDRVLGTFRPADDFTFTVPIPAGLFEPGGGALTIETSRTFRPRDYGSPDPRTLGLRLYSVVVR